MIDFAGLVSRITGRSALSAEAGGKGVATGDSFAALVRFAAETAPAPAEPSLRLVVDNGAAPLAATGDSPADATLPTLTDPASQPPVLADNAAALPEGIASRIFVTPPRVEQRSRPAAAPADVAPIDVAPADVARDGAAAPDDLPASDDPVDGAPVMAAGQPDAPIVQSQPAPIALPIQPADILVSNQPAPIAPGRDMAPGDISQSVSGKGAMAPAARPVIDPEASNQPATIDSPGAAQPPVAPQAPSLSAAPNRPVRPDRIITVEPAIDPEAASLPDTIDSPVAAQPAVVPQAAALPATADRPVRPDRIVTVEPAVDPAASSLPDTIDSPGAAQPPVAPQASPLPVSTGAPVRPARIITTEPGTLPPPVVANMPAPAAPQPGDAAQGAADTLPSPIAANQPAAMASDEAIADGDAPVPAEGEVRVAARTTDNPWLMRRAASGGQARVAPMTERAVPEAAVASAPATGGSSVESDTAETRAPAIGPDRAGDVIVTPETLRAAAPAAAPADRTQIGAPGVSVSGSGATAQALGERVIDMGVSGQWIDRMAREISALAQGGGQSRFVLNPPHLGRLDVEIALQGDVANIRMTAETDEAAQRLNEARPAMQADARVAALAIGTFTIEKAHGQSDPARDQGGGQRGSGDMPGQAQQQAAGGQGQGQAGSGRSGADPQRGEWLSRSARDDMNRQTGEGAPAPARNDGQSRVRFA